MEILRALIFTTGALSWMIVAIAVLFMAYGECRGFFEKEDDHE